MSVPYHPVQRLKKPKPMPSTGTTPPTNLLDAYVDHKSPDATLTDEGKPLNKKNKNKKKREQREAEERRRQSESATNPPDEDEVVDSWEDISAADAPALPKTAIKIEALPPKKEEIVAPKVTKPAQPSPVIHQSEKFKTDCSPKDHELLKALDDLQKTLKSVSQIFEKPLPGSLPEKLHKPLKDSTVPKTIPLSTGTSQPKSAETSQNVPVTTDLINQACPEEKDAAAVKAEREAKKLAKAAAKQAAKSKEKSNNQPEAIDTSAPEDNRQCIEKAKITLIDSAVKAKENQVAAPVQTGEQVQKSKAELKAERRAKQEAQRAAKEQQKASNASQKGNLSQQKTPNPSTASASEAPTKPAPPKSQRVSDDIQADRLSVQKKRARQLEAQQIPPRTKAQKKVLLFNHLQQFERELSVTRTYQIIGAHIDPAVLKLGLQFAEGTIQGSNARCLALLYTLRKVISAHEKQSDLDFARDLDGKLKLYISFLKECRPHSVSMGNVIRSIKMKLNSCTSEDDEKSVRDSLILIIDDFRNMINMAADAVYEAAVKKMQDGDVILTYGCSSLLRAVLTKAANQTDPSIKFRVVVADSRPKLEGREMVRHLVKAGIHCTYIHISAVPYIIKEVTKVFIGAHAVLANGYVMSRVGTAQLCLVAKVHNVPVMVCCGTHKFSERVQTDSFVFNELGDPDDLVATGTKTNPLEDWRDSKNLYLLNLTYDFTPASLVDAIISDVSVIPCSSVPVILRLKKDIVA